MFAPSTPHYFVTAQPPPKISFVQFFKNRTQIEMCTFVLQVQLPLHRKPRVGEFPFWLRLLCHLRDLKNGQVETTLTAFARVTRKVVTFANKIMQAFEHQVFVSI